MHWEHEKPRVARCPTCEKPLLRLLGLYYCTPCGAYWLDREVWPDEEIYRL